MSPLVLAVAVALAVPAEGEWVALKKKPTRNPERAAAISTMWSNIFAAPAQHAWDLDLSLGWQWWQRAHGARIDNALFRLTARRQLRELPGGSFLGGAAFLDASWLNAGTNQLDIDETQLAFGLGAGLLRWQGRFRLDATLEGGALLRLTRMDDGQQTRRAAALDPAVGLTAGAAVALFGRALVGLRSGFRYHPGRLDVLLTLDLGWAIDVE